MKRFLVVIDVQNDFITGSLENEAAQEKLDNIAARIERAVNEGDTILYTLDTHSDNYLETLEGEKLPVPHCKRGTIGWEMPENIASLLNNALAYQKDTFGSRALADFFAAQRVICRNRVNKEKEYEIEIIGFCTDICVISNALLIRAAMPNAKIKIRESCTAGTTEVKEDAAFAIAESNQIDVIYEDME